MSAADNYFHILLLKILLDGKNAGDDFLKNDIPVNAGDFLEFARLNVALIRTYDWLNKNKIPVPNQSEWALKTNKERQRISDTILTIVKIKDVLDKAGIPHIFPKALQHYPDMGHDIDLVVKDKNHKSDTILKTYFAQEEISPGKTSILNRLSGKTTYEIASLDMCEIEIHHNKMGQLGEFSNFVSDIFADREISRFAVGGETYIPVLSGEYALILNVMQRIYGHFTLRISDIARFITLAASDNLNHDKVLELSRKYNLKPGLKFFTSLASEMLSSSCETGTTISVHDKFRAFSTKVFSNESTRKSSISLLRYQKGYKITPIKVLSLLIAKLTSDIAKLQFSPVIKLCFLAPLAVLINISRKAVKIFNR